MPLSNLFGISSGRELLTADRTYYVATTGSDSNNGLTVGTPFLTIQKAVDVICGSLDMDSYQVTVQVADGTYTGNATLKSYIGTKYPILKGNYTTPANCLLNITGADAIDARNKIVWGVGGFKIVTATSGSCIAARNGALVYVLGKMEYGSVAALYLHLGAFGAGSAIIIQADYAISGGADSHWSCNEVSNINCVGRTITLIGTPAFAYSFARSRSSQLTVNGNTFVGGATGQYYNASQNGVIFVNGAGGTYLPGNAAGAAATGGQYV